MFADRLDRPFVVGSVDRDHADAASPAIERQHDRLGAKGTSDHERQRGDGLGTGVDRVDSGGWHIVRIDAGEHPLDGRGVMAVG
ncbi:MAG: hypothetical protein ACO371_04690 [Ilumatobacteraceae bacterium]